MRIIYVDNEVHAIENFKYYFQDAHYIADLTTFTNSIKALQYVKENKIDIAFLDIDMPEISGIQLAEKLKEIYPHIEIIFVTGYEEYALQAYQLGAIGYLLKPYSKENLIQVLSRAHVMCSTTIDCADYLTPHVLMRTFGEFDVFVDSKVIPFKNKKAKELLALLVDRRGGTMTAAMITSYLWEDKIYDAVTKSYVWRTAKELERVLKEYHISKLFINDVNAKSIDLSYFVCDYYEVIKGNNNYKKSYTGLYMNQYSWGEETVPFIDSLVSNINKNTIY